MFDGERATTRRMPTPLKPTYNLHTLYMYRHGLGVECSSCRRRAVALADKVDDFKGDMRELRDLRFKCTACGSHDWTGCLFVTDAEQEAWLEGLVVSPMDGGRPSF